MEVRTNGTSLCRPRRDPSIDWRHRPSSYESIGKLATTASCVGHALFPRKSFLSQNVVSSHPLLLLVVCATLRAHRYALKFPVHRAPYAVWDCTAAHSEIAIETYSLRSMGWNKPYARERDSHPKLCCDHAGRRYGSDMQGSTEVTKEQPCTRN